MFLLHILGFSTTVEIYVNTEGSQFSLSTYFLKESNLYAESRPVGQVTDPIWYRQCSLTC